MATLFFGGWDIPFTAWDNVAPHIFMKTLATFLFFWLKIMLFVFVFIWIRWTLPRFRYDQLMSLGWKFMLPTSLAYIVVVASATLGMSAAGINYDTWQFALIMLAINIVLVVLLFGILDRGRLISPAYSRLDKQNLAKVRAARYERVRLEPVTTEGGAD
jgi:NADH-quinone oxidoreductase subunit H